MNQEQAEIIALTALGWLVNNDELCPVFLGATGASIDDMREKVNDISFLGAVLDFITMDDAWVVAFCDKEGLDYEQPLFARQALPGAQNVHWT
ncbi:DUF3572 domain-containing protein [Yoonia sediminilitoris]|uniref:Uncharacterized protein DUF3572 n=1 Tax=Yoonia sediminilitoris TaxID=1286148 RepID=A0A2T6KB49_9RHOB|nr:DUF3572 domain-containing protein [Yoonia sediminilitoris]PUB12096.1 uncharacterized protein DUF3572 [Yoonia sediminilitoris]RCW92923.1 uncharacterized protein DUF3572 [Yoonia sediminilitoris]